MTGIIRAKNMVGILVFTVCPRATILAESSRPAFETRGWVLLDYNMPYLRKMVPLAAREGINHIQFCHRIGMQLSDYLEPQWNKDVRELIALAHQHGIKAYAWTHELDEVPERFMKGGKVAVSGDAFWEWVRGRYETLLKALPDIDGVIITLTETKVPIDDDNLVSSPLAPPERFIKMAQAIYDVLRPRGKEIILRTFTWIPEDYDWMLEAFRRLPEDITIMSKVNWGDWYQHFPSNPFIGKVAPHRQVIEFDLVGQYHGDTHVPWVCADFLQKEMRYALSKKATGVIGRVDWGGHAYGSANEFNAVAFARLARDPSLDLDALWAEWATGKYGPEAAPHVILALKRTNEIVNLLFFTLGFKALKYSGTLHRLSYMEGSRVMHSLFCRDVQGRWKPELIPAAEELLHPTMDTMTKSIAEKERAIELIDLCLEDLEKARPHLSGADYGYLAALFRNEKLIATCWRWINEAYFRYLFWKDGDAAQRGPLEEALERITALAREVDLFFGDRLGLLRPEAMRDFVNDIRVLLDHRVKWFVTTNHESGRTPLPFDLNGDGSREIVINGRDNCVHACRGPGKEVWRHDTFGLRVRYPNVSDPVSADVDGNGKAEFLIGAADGGLYVFAHNGKLKWKYKAGNAFVSAPAVLTDARGTPVTVCASLDGYLYGLSSKGSLLWKVALDGVVDTNPVVRRNESPTIVLCTRDGNVQSFSAKGELLWKLQWPAGLTGALSQHRFGNEKLISAGCGHSLVVIDPAGKVVTSVHPGSQNEKITVAAKTVLVDNKPAFVFGTDKGNLWAVDIDGNPIFKSRLGAEIRTPVLSATIGKNPLLFVGVDNAVAAVNYEGQEVWRFTATSNGFIGSALVILAKEKELIFTALDRKLYVIDLEGIVNE